MSLLPIANQELSGEIARALAIFENVNAQIFVAPTLLPAAQLLDLYGEDIRERAYIVHDPLEGDLVLRPDFTLPVVNAHMKAQKEPANYAYSGRVWRRRRETNRADKSFWQMGFEHFDKSRNVQADADIFALARELALPFALREKLGDLGLIFALLDELDIADFRREALKRHIWRPRAFARLLARFSSVDNKHENLQLDPSIPVTGMRSAAMIEARIARLDENTRIAPISPKCRTDIEAVLALEGNLASVENDLRVLAGSSTAIKNASAEFIARNAAFADKNIDPSQVQFSAEYGRESMEYYDGLVFGFYGQSAAPIISGGRYDRLTSQLGAGRVAPAIGLAYRPELALREGGA